MMNKKFSIVALATLITASSSAFAANDNSVNYDVQEYVSAQSLSPKYQIKEMLHNEKDPLIKQSTSHKFKPKLISNYIQAKYVGIKNNDDSGYELGAGFDAKNIELTGSYGAIKTIIAGKQKDVSNTKFAILFPLMLRDNLSIQGGVSYIGTKLKNESIKNNSVFGTLKIKGAVTDSLLAYGSADFELNSTDPDIGGEGYKFHDETTYRAGIEYFLTRDISMGADVSFGSELDKAYTLHVAYKF